VQTLEKHKSTVEQILQKHGVRYTIEWYVSGEPFYTAPGLLSDAVGEAVAQVTGARPRLSTGGGTSDGRFIAPLGAQVVELGVVNASIHKVNEHVRTADVDALERMYLNVLRRLLT
jgi:succinyl-diaminopimelate desuccinylase